MFDDDQRKICLENKLVKNQKCTFQVHFYLEGNNIYGTTY